MYVQTVSELIQVTTLTHIVKPDGLSIKKRQIHDLQEEFSKTGLEANKKYILLSTQIV